MIGCLYRVLTVARVTLTEAVRQKVLAVLLLFGLVLISTSVYTSQITVEEQIKWVKDSGTGSIGIIGLVIAVLSVAQLLPQEIHNRTIYTILAKPVRRGEFLLGKFFGVVMLLTLCVAIMTVAFAATLWVQEMRGLDATRAVYDRQPGWEKNPDAMAGYQHDVDEVVKQASDPQLVKAILLVYAKLIMTAAIALLISTFATSLIFTFLTTLGVYVIGYLEGTARDVWLGHGAESVGWHKWLLELLSLLVPDMNAFTIADEINAGNMVPWDHTFNLLGYAAIYTLVLLIISELIFEFREL